MFKSSFKIQTSDNESDGDALSDTLSLSWSSDIPALAKGNGDHKTKIYWQI